MDWHKKRYKDKLREIEKRAPGFLFTKKHPYHKLLDKMMVERHWHSGMDLESNGRSNLHGDLKKLAQSFNSKNFDEHLSENVNKKYDVWEYRY